MSSALALFMLAGGVRLARPVMGTTVRVARKRYAPLLQGVKKLAPDTRASRLSWIVMVGFAYVVIALSLDASVRESTRAWLMNESLAVAPAPPRKVVVRPLPPPTAVAKVATPPLLAPASAAPSQQPSPTVEAKPAKHHAVVAKSHRHMKQR